MPVDVQSVEVHPSNEEVVNIEGTIELAKENEVEHTDDTGKKLVLTFIIYHFIEFDSFKTLL